MLMQSQCRIKSERFAMDNHFLLFAAIFLSAAVLSVPISKKLGLGTVLGYLIAGLIIGPSGFSLIKDVEAIYHFSEFGVVLFMFVIGLELDLKKLWSMRMSILGVGGAQVLFTFILSFLACIGMGYGWTLSVVIGMALSLSSTAMTLQIFREKNWLGTSAGQSAFSILLFQDIVVILFLALLPLLAVGGAESAQEGTGFVQFLKIIFVFVVLFTVGRKVLRWLFDRIASLHLREIFTALSLLLIISMALLMQYLEISMAMGAFLAGVLLADSEYKHALETDIEPFKGILLGLFFISVGMTIDLIVVQTNTIALLGLIVVAVVAKVIVLITMSRVLKIPSEQRLFYALSLSQVGEFAFVLFGVAKGLNILSIPDSNLLTAAAAFSMLTTPFFVFFHDKFYARTKKPLPDADKIENEFNPVIIAGFGRFGQIIGRLLYALQIQVTVLDHEPSQIEMLRRFGFKIYFGDATRLDLLEAAGAKQAKILVVAIDDVEENLKLVDLAQAHFPHLKIFARARNVQHVYDLLDRKVESVERETFESSLKLGVEILKEMGWPAYQAHVNAHKFKAHNWKLLLELHKHRGNEQTVVAKAKQARVDLEKMFAEDKSFFEKKNEGWS